MAKRAVQISRIILPATADGWKQQITDINTKHVADGVNSVLTAYLTENNITIANVISDATDAVVHDKNSRKNQLDGKEAIATRRLLANPAFSDMKKGGQLLKRFYSKNPSKVNDWGLPLGSTGRFNYPTDFTALKNIWDLFFAKHGTFAPGTSPLAKWLTENNIDLTQHNTDVVNAATQQTTAASKKATKEQETQLRNTEDTSVEKIVRGMCQYLKNQFSNNPKKLGGYVIRVDDSPRGITRQKSTLLPSGQKQITDAFVGGLLINSGITPLELSKGKTISPSPVTVAAGSQFAIPKGYSTITVVNTSSAANGEFLVDVHK